MARTPAELERGREAYSGWAWLSAYESLSAADRSSPLEPEDLERLATSAYMLGQEDEYVDLLERAHREHVAAGQARRAVRCAWWIGIQLYLRGEPARANGWFGRAERLLERDGDDCVERGYLLVPRTFDLRDRGDEEGVREVAAEVAAIGERFGDADLVAFGLQDQGQALMRLGRTSDGLRLLDETMLAVTSGTLSPITTGLVYCNTIAFCQNAYELPRAREWTDALTRWCEGQPDMVAHTGVCLVHRAEIMELAGSWEAALEEARRARERLAQTMPDRLAVGGAVYRQGELHRLRGDLDAAETAYREAARCGWEPQPGLAFLRLAQGRADAAEGAMRRALGEEHDPLARLRLLPAAVEILLAAEQLEEAARTCAELEELCGHYAAGGVPEALASQARGAIELAGGAAQPALGPLRRSFHLWSELHVPYEAARTRVLVGRACEALGDAESAGLELDAARATFEALGATPEVARIDALTAAAPAGNAHGLTGRELEVLRLVAAGKSNRAIADELVISEHTVARHLQNIFAKLGVSSRTAASAFAFEHDLV